MKHARPVGETPEIPAVGRSISRRGWLTAASAAPLAAGLAGCAGTPSGAKPVPSPYLAKLGVEPIINAAGYLTALGGAVMPPEVADAMRAGANVHVPFYELYENAGKYIAEVIGVEAALISAGAASAATIAAAACMAGSDRDKVHQLPDTTGMRHEIIIQKNHRQGYDHAPRAAGAKFVVVETEAEFRAAFNDKTAMVYQLGAERHFGKREPGRSDAAWHRHRQGAWRAVLRGRRGRGAAQEQPHVLRERRSGSCLF